MRRSWRSSPLLRAALAGLFVLVGVGSVVAGNQPSEDTLTLPAVHSGDRGDYEASLLYEDGTPAGQRAGHWTALTFLVHDAQVRLDEEGRPHAAHVLETFTTATPGGQWTSAWEQWWTDATTGATIARDQRWAAAGVGGSVPVTSGNWTATGNFTEFGQGAPLCGLHSDLAGARPTREPLVLDGGCSALVGLGSGGKTVFRFEGTDPVDGRPSYRYAPVDGGPVRVWFSSGIPAPVRILQPAVADGAVRDVMVRLTLKGWEAGPAPETMPILPVATHVPALENASYDNATGLPAPAGHPFPHTDAIAVAKTDPRSPVPTFLASHPDSYLLVAASESGTVPGSTWFRWTLVWTDGIASQGVQVTRRWPSVGDGSPTELPLLQTATQVSAYQSETAGSWLPDPWQVPRPPFPTPASVLDRWQALTGAPRPAAPVYGFGTWCQDYGCTRARAWTYAGLVQSTGGLASSGKWDYLMVDVPEGPVRLLHEDSAQVTRLAVGGVDALPSLGEIPLPPTPPRAPAAIAAGLIWSPAGAGTFAAAFLVAVVTYLWPTLKSGAAALFSRIAPEDTADHPARQAILDVVAAQPGIHFQGLCRALGKGRGVVGHHVTKLLDSGHLVRQRHGGFACYFVRGANLTGSAGAAAAALKAEGALRLLQALSVHGGQSGLELSASTGLSPSTVHYHLRKLAGAGLIVSVPRGRSLAMSLTPEGREMAARQGLGGLA